jgi:hypothetical protein
MHVNRQGGDCMKAVTVLNSGAAVTRHIQGPWQRARQDKRMKRSGTGALGVALILLTATTPAYAYLDPSTGSMILSAIIGLFATMALAVKTYWYRLKNLFRRESDKSQRPEEQPGADPDTPAD